MIRRVVSWGIGFIGLGSFLYVFFFVPMERQTLYEHMSLVLATREAHDMGTDVKQAVTNLKGVVVTTFHRVSSKISE